MENEIYTLATTYVLSRLAILAGFGFLVYSALAPKMALSRVHK